MMGESSGQEPGREPRNRWDWGPEVDDLVSALPLPGPAGPSFWLAGVLNHRLHQNKSFKSLLSLRISDNCRILFLIIKESDIDFDPIIELEATSNALVECSYRKEWWLWCDANSVPSHFTWASAVSPPSVSCTWRKHVSLPCNAPSPGHWVLRRCYVISEKVWIVLEL